MLREFCALDVPVYIVSAAYTASAPAGPAPDFIKPAVGGKGKAAWPSIEGGLAVGMTLGELLPMSFGPENLGM